MSDDWNIEKEAYDDFGFSWYNEDTIMVLRQKLIKDITMWMEIYDIVPYSMMYDNLLRIVDKRFGVDE